MTKLRKILVFSGFALILAMTLLYIIVIIKSAKINSFEECKKGGWLIRAMAIYDYILPTEEDIEQECVLWGGEKFVKRYGESSSALKMGPLYALRDFAKKIDGCQNFGKQSDFLNFTKVGMDATYDNFGVGTPIENGYIPTIEEKVGIFQDNDVWAGNINEYKVDLKTNTVVSMRSIVDPNGTPSYAMTAEEAKRLSGERKALYTFNELPPEPDMITVIRGATEEGARRCLKNILGEETFGKISTSEYKFTQSVGKEVIGNSDNDSRYAGQNHVLRWENKNYVPPKGLISETFPFVQIVITNSGHVLNYESNLSFFESMSK